MPSSRVDVAVGVSLMICLALQVGLQPTLNKSFVHPSVDKASAHDGCDERFF